MRWLVAVGLAASVDCKSATCTQPLEVVPGAVTDEDVALPVLGGLVDVERRTTSGFGCEYSDEEHEAKLGPLSARYAAWNYKGQIVTTNGTVSLCSATCTSTTVSFTMVTRDDVRIRHDPKRDVYIITNAHGSLEPGKHDSEEKRGGIIVRIRK